MVLEVAGYQVRTAIDAEATFEVLESFRPRLILMDIQLPGMDGLEITRRLKTEPGMKSVPIVALTAFAMKGDDEIAIDAGCDGYISKPINVGTFPEQIRRYLSNTAG